MEAQQENWQIVSPIETAVNIWDATNFMKNHRARDA
jgi:hypothetical protein